MSKTENLRTVLTERLQTACPRVCYAQAKSGTDFPYLVYTVETLGTEDDLERIELEVNAVDYGTDTGPCEALADAVEELFDRWYYLDDQVQLSTYLDRRQPVAEEDRSIIRRRILIEIHFYERRPK